MILDLHTHSIASDDGRAKVERPQDAPTLRLEGTAILGGWGIRSGGIFFSGTTAFLGTSW